ncbi:hypothetical protein [Nostoc sp. 106C]|nr:hypothetical protein [Nostoc sp. 106C]
MKNVQKSRSLATHAGLDSTNRIFEVNGTRATVRKYGFDPYWKTCGL